MTIAITDITPKTYVVLGMHQSGTSFIADCLRRNGVNMGVNEISNVMENNDFVAINNQILGRAGGSWEYPPTREAILKQANGNANEISKAIDKNKSKFWGFKDPRTSLTAECYFPYLQDDVYVVAVFRKPKKVGKSLARRGDMGEARGMELAKEYDRRILKAIKTFCEL